jgi:DNA polymerase-3 subunit epsilon
MTDVIARLLDRLRPSQPIAFFDVETTGVMPAVDRVVSIAILRVEPTGEVRRFYALCHPERAIPAEATAVHGITDDMVAGEPRFKARIGLIEPLLSGAVLCGFNGTFDVKMVGAEYQRAGLPNTLADQPLIDPFRIFQDREKRDLSAAVRLYAGREMANAHDAMADVEATLEVLVGQVERYEDLPRNVAELAKACKRTDPSWLDPDGKVIWRDGEARLSFGPKAGESLRKLAATDRGLLQWILKKDFSREVKTIVENALVGNFPTAPAPRAGEAVTVL